MRRPRASRSALVEVERGGCSRLHARVALPHLRPFEPQPEERGLWKQKGAIWTRKKGAGVPKVLRLRVGPSAIDGHGIFALGSLEPGQLLGRFSGRVLHKSESEDDCDRWALPRADERTVIVRSSDGKWCAVDVRGSLFEWANHADEDEATMVMSRTGELRVAPETYVEHGDELTWNYGRLYGFDK